MIHLSLALGWTPVKWRGVVDGMYSLSTNKMFEWQIARTWALVTLGINWHIRQSHAGIEIDFGLFTWEVRISILDKRHWDCKKGTWEVNEQQSV